MLGVAEQAPRLFFPWTPHSENLDELYMEHWQYAQYEEVKF